MGSRASMRVHARQQAAEPQAKAGQGLNWACTHKKAKLYKQASLRNRTAACAVQEKEWAPYLAAKLILSASHSQGRPDSQARAVAMALAYRTALVDQPATSTAHQAEICIHASENACTTPTALPTSPASAKEACAEGACDHHAAAQARHIYRDMHTPHT